MKNFFGKVACYCSLFQHPLLLIIRLYWGWSFFQAGWGKFGDLGKVTGFFTSLGIPAPGFHAVLVATVETVGGLLFLLGLFSRLAAIPLSITMIVALSTAHVDVLHNVFNDPQAFVKEDAFIFLYAALIVLSFGPGRLSLDALMCRCCSKTKDSAGTTCCATK